MMMIAFSVGFCILNRREVKIAFIIARKEIM